ncbi:class I SAM-dependent methyltransferase [Methylophaga thiooxydans]|uniref:class I SAM-dependent methyltransferase n=1 Tax=Methylophaga thiooxydans TaxID=392484 RepID=UPI002355A2A6|nr:SAM-dependent methyltransferase [Methylophaga thiooxydans]
MNDTITIAADNTLAQQHSDQLKALITAEIEQQGGFISFADYMQRCLYQPGFGYYSAGSHKLGQGGDFTTAPEISPLFGYAVANQVHDALQQCTSKHILEFGAGSGQLAIAMLTQLESLNALPERYFILEISADLQARQQQLIEQQRPDLADRVEWIHTLPDAFNGVMLANEVCDAMPVHLLRLTTSGMFERGVRIENGNFIWQDKKLTHPRLIAFAERINKPSQAVDYLTEVNLNAVDWMQTAAASLQQGAIFIIDYGYPFNDYYAAERAQGTLRSYYRQQAIDDPLQLPGLQDISAHVDFTTLAETALEGGCHVAGFHEQGDFLVAGNITQIAAQLEAKSDALSWLQHSAALKQLLMPHVMGYQFKVLSLSKAIELLPRLQLQDRRYQL